MTDLDGVEFYTDSKSSVVDAKRAAEDRIQGGRVYALNAVAIRAADAYLASNRKSLVAAECVLNTMHAWASAGALLGHFNRQGSAHRMWALNSAATTFLVIRADQRLDQVRLQQTANWLAKLGWRTKETQGLAKNNHLYWAASAAAGAAIAADDKELFNWSMRVAENAVSSISDAGVLPLEIARGKLAMHYTVMALESLVILAEYGQRNGYDLYSYQSSKLRLLIDLVVRNISRPTEIEEIAGMPQEWAGPNSDVLVWMEPVYARFPNAAMRELLQQYRPLRQGYWGGNSTLQYGIQLK